MLRSIVSHTRSFSLQNKLGTKKAHSLSAAQFSTMKAQTDNFNSCPYVKASCSRGAGIVKIERPEALNSLNLDMVNALSEIYKNWENKHSVKMIIVKSDGRAFCSGGDVVSIYKASKNGTDLGNEFFRREYELNYFIHTLQLFHVAFINGIVMGGGAGISVNGHFSIATEKTVFAMPEVNIGFIPDVGGSYFLSRLKNYVGTYLALTGKTLSAYDVKKAGIATHYVQSKNLDKIQLTLETVVSRCYNDYDHSICLFEDSKPVVPENTRCILDEHGEMIRSVFSKNTVTEIVSALEKETSAFAKETLKSIRAACPISVHLSLEMQRRGAEKSLAECLQMEYTVALNILKKSNFYEGVRAVLVDKTRDARWSPARLEDVTPAMIEEYFKPTPGIPPLNLNLQRTPRY
ncbi:3-hydroxyisobutyryl-CoA hydrolase, mitochondrial-like [Schistocerca gregaria]|uniref:3-hydroxyisobutyryl-CoA hydrolase, mitochondrial-like n=1 Tax=Schistocerca gregaria TaxID=7010 RepID=UPI00211F2B71|nr:3-hydroxyisobutyryl-CoA hydrolase, mitochondrial-like [Schistocerca gregaria]